MSEQDRKFVQEIILTLISTAAFLVIYWFQGMDESERQVLISRVKRYVQPKERADRFKTEILRFRAEISRWEHEQRGNSLCQSVIAPRGSMPCT